VLVDSDYPFAERAVTDAFADVDRGLVEVDGCGSTPRDIVIAIVDGTLRDGL
jgi:ABC-type methionine transport system permease subunit